jgi:hypothetical protein
LQSRGGVSEVIRCLLKVDYKDKKIHNTFLLFRYFPSFPLVFKKHIYLSSFYKFSLNPYSINICIVHDMIYELFPLKTFGNLLHRAQRLLTFIFSNHLVFISNSTKNDFFKIYPFLKYKKHSVIYNGVELPCPSKDSIILPFNNYFLYVGSTGFCKSIDHAIQVANNLPECNFVFVVSSLKSYCDSNNIVLPKNIFVLSKLSKFELSYLYTSADASFITSLYEGFGLTIVESLLSSTPCFGANTSSIKELLPYNYLFEHGDINMCVKLLTKFISYDQSLFSVSFSKFNSIVMQENYVDLFKRLLK